MWKYLLTFGILATGIERLEGAKSKVLRIKPTNEEQIDVLLDLIDIYHLDVWKSTQLPKPTFDILVKNAKVEKSLHEEHIPYNVMVHDVDKLMENEQKSNQKLAFSSGYDYSKYGTWDEILSEIKNLANIHSNKASLFNVGKTFEKRDQIGIKITNGDGNDKPVIWVDGGIHAREWISPASVIYLVKQLLTSDSDKIKSALSKYDFHILPVFNIDGFVYTHKSKETRLWRKTRTKSGYKCIGVDPNRNWGSHFGGKGTSDDPCSNIYHGKYAFSEISVQNVATYLANLPHLKAYWNVHAYSNLVLTPWSYTTELPKDYEEIKRVGDVYAKEVVKRYGTKYTVGPPGEILYPVGGGSIDWTYEALGVIYSYALELRDDGKYGFLLPTDQIIPCAEEFTDALIASVLAMK